MKYKYVLDTKLAAYYISQRGQNISSIFNKVAEILYDLPKGDVYLAFDIGHSDFRESVYEEYKGQRRSQMDKCPLEEQEAHKQFNIDYASLVEGFNLLGMCTVAIDGVEADDIASLLCKQWENDGEHKVTLITLDQDWYHMVIGTDNIRLYEFPAKEFIYDKGIQKTHGVKNRREFSILKAIVGDASDNLKFLNNLAKVKGGKLFNDMIHDIHEPTNEEAIEYIIEKTKDNHLYTVHDFHVKHGRTTIKEAFMSNIAVADPFQDCTHMTTVQEEAFVAQRDGIKTECCDPVEFSAYTLKHLKSFAPLSEKAKKIYGSF